jgi:hypothetical protein
LKPHNIDTDVDVARRAPVDGDFIAPGTLIERARKAGISITKHRRVVAEVLETMFNCGEYLPPVAILARAQALDATVTENAVRTFLRRLADKKLIERSPRHVIGQIIGPVIYEIQRRQAETTSAGVLR